MGGNPTRLRIGVRAARWFGGVWIIGALPSRTSFVAGGAVGVERWTACRSRPDRPAEREALVRLLGAARAG